MRCADDENCIPGGVQQQGRERGVGAPRGQQGPHPHLQDPVQHHLPL